MRLYDGAVPVRMRRIGVVALRERLRDVLLALADAGTVDLAGALGSGEGPAMDALRRLDRRTPGRPSARPALATAAPDVDRLEREGARALLAGEVELDRRRRSAVERGEFVLMVGWAPAPSLEGLAARVEGLGATMVELPPPPGDEPPTLLAGPPAAEQFRPLVTTYGAVPYEDVDPTLFVAVTYCVMFGMMFGDAGDGLLIVFAALVLRRIRRPSLRPLRRVWATIAAAGVAATAFGVLYGEFFGPTTVLPVVWLSPLDSPTRLIVAAIILGVCLLAAGHVLGIVNRWREGGARAALGDVSGVPGLALLAAAALVAAGTAGGAGGPAVAAGVAAAVVAVAMLAVGLRAEAGDGALAIVQVIVGLFDALVRLFSNVVSFARLAAFGLMHAALAKVVLDAAGAMAGSPAGDVAAVIAFVLGGALAFTLEGVVAAAQALRLEYYELFSRMFVREGRPFAPWKLPLSPGGEAP